MTKQIDDEVNAFLENRGVKNVKLEGVGKGKNGNVKNITLTLEQSIDQEILQRALESKDELMIILLISFEIEIQLSGFLDTLFGESHGKLNFAGKISKLKTCQFENDIVKVVDGFRKLRNKFAHDKNASFEKYSIFVSSIFDCKLPTLMDFETNSVVDENGKSTNISDLPTVIRLYTFAYFAILFLAGANQIYKFQKPEKLIVMKHSSK